MQNDFINVQNLIYVQSRAISLAFSGGEALIAKDFWKVAKYVADKGLYVQVFSNGPLLNNNECLDKLHDANVGGVHVTVNGANAKTHDSFIGKDGYWEKNVKAIENAKQKGFWVETDSVITKRNFSELDNLVTLIHNLGADSIKLIPLFRNGRGKDISDECLSTGEKENLLEKGYGYFVEGKHVLVGDPRYSLYLNKRKSKNNDWLKATETAAEYVGGCYAGRFYLTIQPNGIVTPCPFLPIKAGDSRKKSLSEIWQNSRVLEKLQDRDYLKGKCGKCGDKDMCGGCRGRAYSHTKDFLASDPECPN